MTDTNTAAAYRRAYRIRWRRADIESRFRIIDSPAGSVVAVACDETGGWGIVAKHPTHPIAEAYVETTVNRQLALLEADPGAPGRTPRTHRR